MWGWGEELRKGLKLCAFLVQCSKTVHRLLRLSQLLLVFQSEIAWHAVC